MHHLEHGRGRSAKTLENYDQYLTRFFMFTKAKNVSDLTEKLVNEFRLYLAKLHGAKTGRRSALMKPQTQNCHCNALRSFLKFLHECNIKTLHPKQIVLTKTAWPTLELITTQEQEKTFLLSVTVAVTLQDYLQHRDDTHAARFVRYGRKMHDGGERRLSPRVVECLVARYAVHVSITHSVTPQKIRNNFVAGLFPGEVSPRPV